MKVVFKLIATAFPGGYRFLAVNLVAFFAIETVSDAFAHSFFIVSLIATFSGIAISTQSYVASLNLSLVSRFVFLIGLIALVSPFVFFLWEGGSKEFLVIVLAATTYSCFEIVRADFMSYGKFKALFISACVAMLLLPVSFYFNQSNPYLMALCIFSGLLISVLFFIGKSSVNTYSALNKKVISDVLSYACSNGLSTALTFMLPLFLARELVDNSPTALAQIVTLAMLAYFVPRYLSAGFLVKYKASLNWSLVKKFETRVLLYVAIISAVFWAVFYFILGNELILAMLFMGLLLTQVSLPQANLLMVHGEGVTQLKVNFATFIVFSIAISLVYHFFAQGEIRAQLLVLSYIGLVILRYVSLKMYCHRADFKGK